MKVKNTFFRSIFLLMLLITCSVLRGQEAIGSIPIPDTEDNLTNLSGALNDSISFHLLINKVKTSDQFVSTIHYFNKDRLLKSLNIYRGEERPIYVSFHVNGNVLTLIREREITFNQRKNTVLVDDVDFNTGKTITVPLSLELNTIFSHDHITFLVGNDINGYRDVAFVNSAANIQRSLVNPKTKLEKRFLKSISDDQQAEFINDVQFIEKGSIKDFRGFFYKGNLVFLNDDGDEGIIRLFTLKPSGELTTNIVYLERSGMKQQNTFLKDDLLFTFYMQKNIAFMDIIDLKTENILKKIMYHPESFGPYNKVVINGEQVDDSFKTSKFYNSYFPHVGSVYNASLYLGINKSTTGNYIIQVGHVDKNRYRNNAAGNYWWQYGAFLSLNYNFSSGGAFLSGGFDPVSAAYNTVFGLMAAEKRKGNYFEVVLNKEFQQVRDVQTPEFEYTDPALYDESLKENISLKNQFYIPQKYGVRVITREKDKDAYIIYNLDPLEAED